MKYKIAIASSDGKVVNQHFGRAKEFYIVEVNPNLKRYKYMELRKVEPLCESGSHSDEKMTENVQILSDCDYVLVSKVGSRADTFLKESGIEAFELPGLIDDSLKKLLAYIEIQNLMKI